MVAPSPKKQNAPSKDVTINNVWDKVEFTKAREGQSDLNDSKQSTK